MPRHTQLERTRKYLKRRGRKRESQHALRLNGTLSPRKKREQDE